MKVEIVACLPRTGAVRFDGDGSGHMRFDFSSDQAPDVAKLLLCIEKMIKLTVEVGE